MSNDLEDEIRDALRSRAMTVTDDDLGRRDEPVRTGRRPILAALAAAAVVAALAIGIGVAARPNSNDNKQSSAASTLAVKMVGFEWRLVKGIQGTTNFTSPSRRVEISFYRDAKYRAYDGVNYIGGSYRLTVGGFEVFQSGTTLIGYVGDDPNMLAAQTAFASVASGRSTVTARLKRNGELVLSGPGYTLWFRNVGTVVHLRG